MGSAAEHEDVAQDPARLLREDNELLRRRNHALEIACDRFRALYEQTPTPHLTIAADRVVVDLNDAAATLLGVARDRVLATPVDWLVAPRDRDRFVALVDALFASGRARLEEIVLQRPGAAPLEASVEGVVLAAVPDEPPRAVLALVDLTPRRLIEVARRQAQDEVLAIVSHDLRGPISAIGLACDGLGDDVAAEDRRDCIAAIRRAVARSERLIDDLVRVTHLESLPLALERVRFDVRDLVEQVRGDHEEAARLARSRITVSLGARPATIVGDRDRLHQALSNLLGNALVHARGAAVEISVAGSTDEVVIAVTDRGPGIAADAMPRYRQGGRRRSGDTGLGLALVAGVIEAHQGTVTVTSQLGAGSSVAVALPRAAGDDGPQRATTLDR